MIRHEQAQAAMPHELLMIVFHRRQHSVANDRARHSVRAGRLAQLILSLGHAFDGDEKPTALGNPFRNRVRKLFADRQVHARSVMKSAQSIKRER